MTTLELPRLLDVRREDLGMSKAALAERSGLSLATINRILSGREKRLSLQNVEAVARALDVVISFGASVSFKPVDDAFSTRKKQADKKARRILDLAQGTMGLESQAVEQAEIEQLIRQTSSELLAGPPRKLWEE